MSKMIFSHKPGKPKSDPLNYRPISLLEILAKLFEKIIMNRLLFYLEFHNLLPPNQFGFRPGKSTQQSIHFALETIKENRSQSKCSLVATRDIRKAFDTVWLQGLLYKINIKLQLDLPFTALIYNYVFDRTISPTFENKIAQSFTPLSGVPQGSALGPILFLIFVHDLPSTIHPDTIVLQFADDIVHIVRSDQTSRPGAYISVQRKMKQELIRILEWEESWKIQTCFNKCKIGYSGMIRQNLEEAGGIVVRGNHFEICDNIKILGY